MKKFKRKKFQSIQVDKFFMLWCSGTKVITLFQVTNIHNVMSPSFQRNSKQESVMWINLSNTEQYNGALLFDDQWYFLY